MFNPLRSRILSHRQLARLMAVPVCLLFGGIAQAQVCPVTGNPLPNGGGGVGTGGGVGGAPQALGSPGVTPQGTPGGGGQLGAQGALQLFSLAQQAMQIQKMIHYRQADRNAQRQSTPSLKRSEEKRSLRQSKSRRLTRREKLVARLKQREQKRELKAEELRSRRANGA